MMKKLQPLCLVKMCTGWQCLQRLWSRETCVNSIYGIQYNRAHQMHSSSCLSGSDSGKDCGGQEKSKKACLQISAKRDAAVGKKSTSKCGKKEPKVVTLIPGDGVGPEIIESVVKIFETANAPIKWDRVCHHFDIDNEGQLCKPNEMVDSFLKNKIALKGPIRMIDNTWERLLRREFGIFALVSHSRSLGRFKTVYKPIDVIVIRDCTEGEYTGIEHEVVPGVIQSIKVSTHYASKRLVDYAFDYAVKHKRKKITGAHKANIMRFTDGIILSVLRDDAAKTQDQILFEERFLDTVCHRLVSDPDSFDVIVASSMYGDVVNTVTAGIAGGMTQVASFLVGSNGNIYESAHSAGLEIAGKDEANPTSIILSSILMLRDLGFKEDADKIEGALTQVYCDLEHLTKDLGGCASTTEFTDAVCAELE